MQTQILQTPSLYGDNIAKKRLEIKNYFNECYHKYENLFEILKSDQAFYQKPEPLRHPLIFYFGHTATFFINKLHLAKIIDQRIDPELESIFAVGVDEMSWDDLNDKHYNWPSVKRTREYRKRVQKLVNGLIDTLPLTLPIDWDSAFWVILMGIEHEIIHLETSSVLIRQLDLKYIKDHPNWQPYESSDQNKIQNDLIDVEATKIILGKSKDAKYYGWDNEYGKHEAFVPPFKASKYLVSNGEFLEFVNSGGYLQDKYWEEEGLKWRKFTKATYPTFWVKDGDNFKLRVLTKEIDLPKNWPVEVNFHEAKAYCNWYSKTKEVEIDLPTEDEYMVLRQQYNENSLANISLRFNSSTPVDMFKHGHFYDIVGNVWQWSKSPMYPYDGFEVHPIYDDFTVPTFDNKHNLIKGGSWISCGNEAIKESRYAFRRHFFQHAGFRYVQSSYKENLSVNIYESDEQVSQYCHFGWGKSYFGIDNFPKVCAKVAMQYMQHRSTKRALDVGCAIGRSSFELAKMFDEVIGVDFSTRFIRHAIALKEGKKVRYSIKKEGDLVEFYEISLDNFGLNDIKNKVNFWQADACNLKPIFKEFDLIFAGNLLDRLYDPAKFLFSLKDRINQNGILILTSPYSWQEESTPKDKWLGGFKKDGENYTTLDALHDILDSDFKLLDIKEIEFVLRESERKFQHTISQMSIWERL